MGRDDAEIRRTRLLIEAKRKRNRKKYNPFAYGTSGVEAVVNTEISELTQPLELEAEVYESSEDQSFDGKLILSQDNRQQNSRKVDDQK